MFDYLIIGAGFAGSVLAERLARGSNKKVLLVDKRSHVGGNAYDHYNKAGLLVHKYRPHIFHTNSGEVFQYLSQFTEWRSYQHRVLPSIFLAIYMKRRGLKIVEQEVPHRERSTGLGSIRRWKLLKFSSRAYPNF